MAATNLYIVQTKIRNNFSDHRIFSDAEDAKRFASWTFEEAYAKYASDENTVYSKCKHSLPKKWRLLPLPPLQEGKWNDPFGFSHKVGEDGGYDEISIHLDITEWEMYLLVVYTDCGYRENRDEISVKIIDAPLDLHDIEEIEEEFE